MSNKISEAPPTPQNHEPENILLIRLSAIGDVLRLLPALHLLKKHHPGARITWLTEDHMKPLLEGHPEVDEWIFVPKKDWVQKCKANPFSLISVAEEWASLLGRIREQEFDLVLDFHGLLKSASYAVFSKGKRIVGFGLHGSKEGVRYFYEESVSLPDQPINRVERNLTMLRYLDGPSELDGWVFPLSEAARAKAEAFYREESLDKPVVFIYPGSSVRGAGKRWDPEAFADCALEVSKERELRFFIGWGPGEEELACEVAKPLGEKALVIPATTLPELAAFISKASLFFGGDTGPMHMAWLLHVPVLSVFIDSPPEVNAPPPTVSHRVICPSNSSDRSCVSDAAAFMLEFL